ncbi:hypothetical protein AVL61_15920 [Kocuria rosea subsp. polaris]|uniref:Integrase catalytic domain-containing protein n=1 Tax=Kocuria rosea subsp. polaris TaxID=136273 RepID=A0A0W8I1X3_KOCRO|nr:hypothetical protein AVL61_15920 [Kocuria polaris]
MHRVVTDGSNYRARDFTRTVEDLAGRHQRIKAYTPRHNGKVERFNRLLVDEVLYVQTYASEQARRTAIGLWVNHFNYHCPHAVCGEKPPASRVPARVNNVMPSYNQRRRLDPAFSYILRQGTRCPAGIDQSLWTPVMG